MNSRISRLVLLASGLLAAPLFVSSPVLAQTAQANNAQDKPFLSALFSDNAVLQRDRKIPVWGWTTAGGRVTVKVDGKSTTARADASGRWMARIGPYPAGGPHTLNVTGANATENITRQNILFGDVWLCSGQSNMEMGIRGVNDAQKEIASANFPQIRLFTVPQSTALTPQTTLNTQWLVCTPENVLKNSQGGVQGGNLGFSAVGYFFGRKLNQELGIPIGLIQSAWGGTIAEAWTSESALGTIPDFQTQLAARKAANAQGNVPIQARVDAWLKTADAGYNANWTSTANSDALWKTAPLPNYWDNTGAAELKDLDGIVQFRREVVVPEAWAGKDLTITLGAIDDIDVSYWNGVQIGATNGADKQRRYTIPGAQVKAGANLLAVRVTDTGGPGGMYGPADAMRLALDATNSISLAGDWKFRVSVPASKLASMPTVEDPNNPNRIDVLYNGMIAPLEPFALKGAIWYQGESNAARPEQYSRLLPTLIRDWRKQFSTPLPFHIVQLAGFMAPDEQPKDEPKQDDWPLLRAAQQHTADAVPETGIAIITDIGDQNDIHPRNKQDVGLRLALSALAKDYGKKIEYSGPVLKSATPQGSQIVLTFTHADGGLSMKGDVARVFAIAGADRVWSWATPQINGSSVTLSSPQVPTPVYVRYGWSNLPRATMYNGAMLPAPPFQTTP
ncbi:9-O-acetylesterase [bacterium]|nr:MAG: 9-O-acetylesterase [bacterium]